MKKSYECDFGQVTNDRGHKARLKIEWRLTDGEFAMQGEITGSKTMSNSYGQCLDAMQEWLGGDPLFESMLSVWRRWHLNHMRAGCEHQRAEKWEDQPVYADKPTSAYVKHEDDTSSWNMRIWVPVERGGLLSAPCPTCGYKYGTKWLKEELPADVLATILDWAGDVRVMELTA